MKGKNKYIITMLTILLISLSQTTYAMPLPSLTPIQILNMTQIWTRKDIKPDINTVLITVPALMPMSKPKPLYKTAVDEAKECLGIPYMWGGTSLSGFDCSGLVQYIYKQIGISISRTTYTQVNEGVEVDKNNLRQGDLVFFKKNGDIHHVGIYIGNDQYIHAPQTGEVVKISNLSDRNDYYTARRIIND